MKPTLHICTVATERPQAVEQLLHSCSYYGATLHILGENLPFQGFAHKFLFLQNYIQQLDDHDVVLFIDAYDTLLMTTPEKIVAQFLKMKAPFVVSSDKYCFPDEEFADAFPKSPSSFRYLNSGTYIGYVKALKEFFGSISPIDVTEDDQRLMKRYHLKYPDKMLLDTRCALFLPTFEVRADDIAIDRTKKRVTFLETHTTPAVIHGCRKSLWYQFLYDTLFKHEFKAKEADEKTIFLAILAHDNALFLPRYLQHIEELDYNKKKITLFIRTFNSSDETEKILKEWAGRQKKAYKEIIFKTDDIPNLPPSLPAPQRFKIPRQVRQESLQEAKKSKCDFAYIVDCDTFIAPCTLKILVSKNKPIIAPLLKNFPPSGDLSSNFFADVNEAGSFQEHPDYFKIRDRMKIGTFKVPLVLGAYLIRNDVLQSLHYHDGSFDPEYIIFARSAREHGVEQYICNEQDFGCMIHLTNYPSIEEMALLKTFIKM